MPSIEAPSVEAPPSPPLTPERARGIAKLSDEKLALLVSAALFVLCAWPLALTEVPPYQDLPNHLAAAVVMENPSRYPEFAFNGFFKTNAALFAWLYLLGKVTTLETGARLFALLVLGGNAYVLPRFVLALTGSRKRMVLASLFMWPMVHNWFVSTGMLDFALALPLSLGMLIAVDRQRRAPTLANGILIAVLGGFTWYAHVFPLLVVHLLLLIEAIVSWRRPDRLTTRAVILPIAPVTALVAASLYGQLTDKVGPMSGGVDYQTMLPVWDLAYNMWAEWFYGFSKLSLTSIVPCLLLAWIGITRRKESAPFFSPYAFLVLGLLYGFSPYIVTNWFHVNSRLIPYLWIGLLLRVPERLPRAFPGILCLSAALYSAGMGADFVRLERVRREFIAGIAAVPDGARLLPLLFNHKATSDNTRNVLHLWGYYVMAKHTAAPLLFAHSHSFPVIYTAPPPRRLNHLVLESFALNAKDPGAVCRRLFEGNVIVNDCDAAFRSLWGGFWDDATPAYDYLLVWDGTPSGRAAIPAAYKPVFEQGRLAIYERGLQPVP
jgi:hypothetical protein